MNDLLFDVPWWIPVVLGIIGLALLVNGNRRQKAGLRTAGLAVLLAAVGWAVLSYLVDTPKETCQKQTRHLVQSVVDRDWGSFDRLLAPDVEFHVTGTPVDIRGRESLSGTVKDNVDHIGLKSARISAIQAADVDQDITVTIHVWSNQDATLDRPIDSDWTTDWRKVNGQWRLQEMHGQVNQIAPAQLGGAIRRH